MTKVIRRWGFKSKYQSPFFMVWDEYWDDGEVTGAIVIMNSRDWRGPIVRLIASYFLVIAPAFALNQWFGFLVAGGVGIAIGLTIQ